MLVQHTWLRRKRGRERGARLGRFFFVFPCPGQVRPGGGGERHLNECSKIVRPLVRDEFATREENGCVCVYVYAARSQREERERSRVRPVHFVSAVAFSQVICDNDGARVPLGKGSVPPFVFIVLDLGWLASTSAVCTGYTLNRWWIGDQSVVLLDRLELEATFLGNVWGISLRLCNGVMRCF